MESVQKIDQDKTSLLSLRGFIVVVIGVATFCVFSYVFGYFQEKGRQRAAQSNQNHGYEITLTEDTRTHEAPSFQTLEIPLHM